MDPLEKLEDTEYSDPAWSDPDAIVSGTAVMVLLLISSCK